ncbi:response regulator [Aeoliella sp. SH292]|uniref:response regulator n=1 Tax=Aeoliella sp. SH292 TaxID=3454464 RepID=UPI003F99F86A
MNSSPTILAIDDSPVNLSILAETLAGDYCVELATSGIDGLVMAQQSRPEVVLLDVKMPGQSGYEVCRRIRSTPDLRDCRVIMVSAMSSLVDRLQGYDAGADDYVTKPFDEEDLRTKIEFALRTKRLGQSCGPVGDAIAFVSQLRDEGIIADLELARKLTGLVAESLKETRYGNQIDQRLLDDLRYASVLRDVGMLSIPLKLRDHRGPLDLYQIDSLKEHTLVGFHLLRRLSQQFPEMTSLAVAAVVARSHHENFDGSGYPDGLRGTEIPLVARLMRVVDAFEAELLAGSCEENDRLEAAASSVRRQARCLDPAIVEALESVLPQLQGATCSTGPAA